MKVRRSDTPWGCELLLARTERYASKILCIRAGQRLSLQHHDLKDETLLLLEGEAEISFVAGPRGWVRQRMQADRSYRIRPGQRHRVAAFTDARILEVSTPELDDVVRWEDDYGRAPLLDGDHATHPECRPAVGRVRPGRARPGAHQEDLQ